MKLCLDPSVAAPTNITPDSLALGAWYDSQPAVRRLWGIREPQSLRVVVAIESTPDNDDIYPVWFANAEAWASELRLKTGSPVRLELIDEFPGGGIEVDSDSVLVADLFWRDETLGQPYGAL
jgi:hypothetical protein